MMRLIAITIVMAAVVALAGMPATATAAPVDTNTCPEGIAPELRFWQIHVNGTASGAGWSWCINGPNYSVCDTNVPGPVAGSGAAAIVAAIVASINTSGCAGIIAEAVGDSSFVIGSSCVRAFAFCIGPADATPVCCLTAQDANSCKIDATFAQPYFYDCFSCGDVNESGSITVSDAVYIVNYIFGGGPAPGSCVGNANGDCIVSISDAVYIINYVFGGGPAPFDCW